MRRDRYDATFHKFLSFLEKSQWWSLEDLKAYQDERLRNTIYHAYETVPYYRRVMDERRIKPKDIRSVDDLPKLPILTKKVVRQVGEELFSTAVPFRQRVRSHTGGTTGTALQLCADRGTLPRQWAVWWRHRHRFDIDINDEFVVFAGRNIVPLKQMSPPFWRRNRPMHQRYVSIHHMTRSNMPALLRYLQDRQVEYYSGYPSAVYLVALHMLEHNITLHHPPRATVLGAETLLPHQRRAMEQAFGCVVTDQYGASEQCGNISDCEQRHYHVDMEFGAVEFLPLAGMPCNVRRIVCTGFWNLAMPLIRYDIGDVATLPQEPVECACGRQSPIVEKIDGRIESYIVTPDGRQAGRLDFLFKDSKQIEEAQLVQEKIESVTVKIARAPGYSRRDEAELLDNLRAYLGTAIRFNLEYVPEIPRTANGKFRQIVSHIRPRPQSDAHS